MCAPPPRTALILSPSLSLSLSFSLSRYLPLAPSLFPSSLTRRTVQAGGTVTTCSTMRQAAQPLECAMCGTGAGCAAMEYQYLCWQTERQVKMQGEAQRQASGGVRHPTCTVVRSSFWCHIASVVVVANRRGKKTALPLSLSFSLSRYLHPSPSPPLVAEASHGASRRPSC